MADEQYIYLSPEEDLTSVRERLKKIPNRHIVLVVPPQTQLRSHVSWRLLHSSAKQQGKDVSINSPDRQIRSVAKAVGFRVVDSLEAPGSSKSRTGSGPSRLGIGSKTSSRTPSSKGSPPPQRPSSPVKAKRAGQYSSPVRGNMPSQGAPIPPVMGNIPAQGEQDLQQFDKGTWAQPEDIRTGGGTPPFSSPYDNDDYSLGPSTSMH